MPLMRKYIHPNWDSPLITPEDDDTTARAMCDEGGDDPALLACTVHHMTQAAIDALPEWDG